MTEQSLTAEQHPSTEGHFIEHNGECWQSVFPASAADKSQLHADVGDAMHYMVMECGVPAEDIKIRPVQS